MRSLLKILIFLVLYAGVPSCDECTCCDLPAPGPNNVAIIDYHFWAAYGENLEIFRDVFDYYSPEDTLEEGERLALFFRAPQRQVFATLKSHRSGFLMPSAYACSPVVTPPNLQEFPIDIRVESTADINAQYPAGTDLKPLFAIMEGLRLGNEYSFLTDSNSFQIDKRKLKPLEAVLTDSLNDFLLRWQALILQTTPEQPSKHRFTVSLVFADTTFSASSTEVVFK